MAKVSRFFWMNPIEGDPLKVRIRRMTSDEQMDFNLSIANLEEEFPELFEAMKEEAGKNTAKEKDDGPMFARFKRYKGYPQYSKFQKELFFTHVVDIKNLFDDETEELIEDLDEAMEAVYGFMQLPAANIIAAIARGADEKFKKKSKPTRGSSARGLK